MIQRSVRDTTIGEGDDSHLFEGRDLDSAADLFNAHFGQGLMRQWKPGMSVSGIRVVGPGKQLTITILPDGSTTEEEVEVESEEEEEEKGVERAGRWLWVPYTLLGWAALCVGDSLGGSHDRRREDAVASADGVRSREQLLWAGPQRATQPKAAALSWTMRRHHRCPMALRLAGCCTLAVMASIAASWSKARRSPWWGQRPQRISEAKASRCDIRTEG